MKKIAFSLLIIILITNLTEAQLPKPRRFAPSSSAPELWKLRRYELTGGIGITQFFGDIGGYSIGKNALGFRDFSFMHTRYNFTAALSYRIVSPFAVRLNLSAGTFHATDSRGSNEMRAFESKTSFFEPSLLGEYYFIKSKGESSYIFQKGKRVVLLPLLSTLNLYGFTGIGGIAYRVNFTSPMPLTGTTRESGFAPIVPVGIGVSMAYSGKTNFGLELTGKYAFSDYLDGYTSNFSKANDVYYFLTFTFSYKLPTTYEGMPSFRFR